MITKEEWTLRTQAGEQPVQELLHGQESLLLQSILKGHTGFRLYTDHSEKPNLAVVWDLGHNLHVYARPGHRSGASLESLIYDQIRQAADSQDGLLDFEIQAFQGTELEQIGASFTQHPLMPTDRSFYTLNPSATPSSDHVIAADGCSIVPIDAELLAATELDNLDEVTALIEENWLSRNLFLQHGIGSCVIKGDAIISWCISDYVVDQRCEVGVETDEDYQRQGYALLAVLHLLEQCRKLDIQQVGWHCRKDNVGSMKLAEKAGFTLAKPYVSLHGWFNAFDHLLVNGHYHLTQSGNYEQAGQFYDTAFHKANQEQDALQTDIFNGPTRKWCYYSAACSWSLAGNGQRAIELLEEAIREGWTDAGHLQKDNRLQEAQELPAWGQMLAGISS